MSRALAPAAAAVTLALAAVVGTAAASARSQPGEPVPERELGRVVYEQDCAYCHGNQGEGSSIAPPLTDVGLASVDFQLSTGRMPIDDPDDATRREEPDYDRETIEAVLGYVDSFVDGPDIPVVDTSDVDVAAGGELYRLNCAPCHQTIGVGGVLARGETAPHLRASTPVEVVEAMRVAPGQMPEFGERLFSEEEANQIAAYVEYLGSPEDPGGLDLGHFGPVPEGLVAIVLGLGFLLLVIRWLGERVTKEEVP